MPDERRLTIRRATAQDREGILGVASRALGWNDPQLDRSFFSWKHDRNPWGPSPIWIAERDGALVGFRAFLRWELERSGRRLRLVRAVDTATDPDHQRQGIFRALTEEAVASLRAEGTDAVFNTPNQRSLRGYLQMGWSELGRPTLGLVPRSPGSLLLIARSRVPAERWSEPSTVGSPAADLLADLGDSHLLPSGSECWVTPRTREYLRWRYSFDALRYRAIEVRGGVCVFRVRRRGPSREVAICEWLSPDPDPPAIRRLVRAAGDYAVGVGLSLARHGAIPLPRQGPVVAWRPLCHSNLPALGELGFALGDLELF